MTHKEQRKKKRNARKALLLFLKRTCRACSAFSNVGEWYEVTKKLKMVVEEYSDVLPEKQLKKVNESMELTDLTKSGIMKACKVLKYDLKKLVRKLPMLGSVSAVLVKGLFVAAVAAGAGTVYWNTQKVSVTVVNNGCSDIPIASELPPSIARFMNYPGIDIPLWIVTNGEETFTLPPFTLKAISKGQTLSLELFDQSMSIPLSREVTSITADGNELLNKATTINFREEQTHRVIVTCA